MKLSTIIIACALLGLLSSRGNATGALFVRHLNSQETYQLISIKTYDATVNIQDQIAVTHVDQTFLNSTNWNVESTFIFPLPEGAVITELIYWFNGKRYVASLREKEEAVQAYNNNLRKMIDPALLQDMGDNVFKLNIAPINPQSQVRFEITYAELLPYEFGAVTYRFPLKTTGLSPTPLDRVSVQVDATTAKSFRSFTSPSHANTPAAGITKVSDSEYKVAFGDEHFTPDRDLKIRFETRRDGVDLNVLTYTPSPADSFGVDNFYALFITPPDSIGNARAVARNIVFTADISSSMEGKRIDQLKEALLAFLDGLLPTDRFNIILFSTSTLPYKADMVEASASEVESARKFVRELGALGLTNIDGALQASLAMSFPDSGSNIVVFMTDGLPTWGELKEKAILDSATARNHGRVRIFPFGIGDEVSHSLLDGMAGANGGYATYITSDDSIALVIANYFRRVSMPVLSGLAIDYGGLQTYDRFATTLPDLFYGSQVLQFGRYTNSGTFTISLDGKLLGEPVRVQNTATFGSTPGGNRAVARLWAKRKIDDLLDQIHIYGELPELVKAVVDLSLRYGILTPYTALYSDPNTDPSSSAVPEDRETLLPTLAMLEGNYPNPFSNLTSIVFYLPPAVGRQHVRVAIHDMAGRLVRLLADDDRAPGRYELGWDGRDAEGNPLPSGTYLCRLSSGGRESVRTMILIH